MTPIGAQSPRTERGASPIVTVRQGETVWSLSQRLGVPQRELIDANGLKPPYTLKAGQTLLVPAGRTYLVVAGDTVSALSRRFGVPMNELVRLNRLQSPYTIFVGQALRLPYATQAPEPDIAPVQVAAAPVLPPAPVRRPTVQPAAPAQSTTQSATQSIVRSPQNTTQQLTAPATSATVGLRPPPPASTVANGGIVAAPLPSASQPRQQQPAPVTPPPTAVAPTAPPAPAIVATPTPKPAQPAPIQVARAPDPAPAPPAAAPAPAEKAEPAVAGGRLPPVPARANSSRFAWPVDGRVISSFGPKAEGLRNDGINIAAPRGTAIRAAENGVVVYAGDALRAFGNMLLIRHADGWVSAYAHAERLLVKRGDTVNRGQTVATVGATGDVSQPQLHFQLRRQDKPVDPNPLLL